MALAEGPTEVLDHFINDVANLPAEVAHLFEEAQAKQEMINVCCNTIASRDGQLQKFIKQNGSLLTNPKEESYSKTIIENFDKAQALQTEKVALVQKASALLDRYVKRLDIKIRDIVSDGQFDNEGMPTLLKDSPNNLVGVASSVNTGVNTPLQPLSINTGGNGPSSLASATISQISQAVGGGRMSHPAMAGMHGAHPILNPSHLSSVQSGMPLNLSRPPNREMSGGPEKRRRPEGHLLGPLPRHSSNLAQQASLGPGTPKTATPGPSRAGSAGPRPAKKGLGTKRPDPRRPLKKVGKAGLQKNKSRRITGVSRPSPSTTGEDSGGSDDGSEEETGSFQGAEADDGMDVDDEGADDTKYCYCHKVSYGDMVACDNATCKGQWFHWDCAGLISEPPGEWLCRDCARLPRSKIVKG
ncbi:inhibitor of growth proteins N-terminal histone-binding-domain-containing protein [Venturia nashicola]|uniref:Chromatin modification-related protein n=1 Tax=Venturia nashicola TaxID=86259 RepID=A0A4Z1NJQ3_9PEZI|nr:inhibitor of growth proteins N-terminal histone-binding-domain-containing protein [Venturia nashicola]TLD23394.1 inhibitor of growth proteins N-terminal histone-binding-domain-containing protein [Venturia nashicola]